MKVVAYGTGALLVEGLDPAWAPAAVHAKLQQIPGVRDVLVADGTALLEFGDAPLVDPRPLLARIVPGHAPEPRRHVIQLRYDGPDLAEVARAASMSVEEAVRRHLAPEYVVQLVGFQPGFAYLGPVDPRLDVPRRAQPRPRVPAMSVGLAPGRTAIYPHASPGGWNLIGTAVDATPFSATDGARFRLGDQVRFVETT